MPEPPSRPSRPSRRSPDEADRLAELAATAVRSMQGRHAEWWVKALQADLELARLRSRHTGRAARFAYEIARGARIFAYRPQAMAVPTNGFKTTVFGSARARMDFPSDLDPTLQVSPQRAIQQEMQREAYREAYRFGQLLAAARCAVVTGAGPGIMEAAVRGAGKDHSYGVKIGGLALEAAGTEDFHDEALYELSWFFIRKYLLTTDAHAIVEFLGGFGTFDERYEMITVEQTGKKSLCPYVIVGEEYAEDTFLRSGRAMAEKYGTIGPADLDLVTVVPDAQAAFEFIDDFYLNYRGMKLGEWGALRMYLAAPLTESELRSLNREAGLAEPFQKVGRSLPEERSLVGQRLFSYRAVLQPGRSLGTLMEVVKRVNEVDSAPERTGQLGDRRFAWQHASDRRREVGTETHEPEGGGFTIRQDADGPSSLMMDLPGESPGTGT